MAEMTDAEAEKILAQLATTTPTGEDKQNIHTFLNNVAVADDTTKTGFLRDDDKLNEVGMPKLPVRAYKSMALVSSDIMGNEYFKSYFEKEGEIITSTSLSRDAKLLNLAVLTKKEIEDTTKTRKKNKGWFTPKSDQQVIVQR